MATVTLDGDDLILKFEIEAGRSPEVESVAAALIAWTNVLRAAASAIEPDDSLVVELSGVEPGSQIFKFLLRRAEENARRLETGSRHYPLVSQMVIALGASILTTTVASIISDSVKPDSRIPADQMQIFEQMSRDLSESVDLQKRNSLFYGVLQDEPAFKGIEVLDGASREPLYKIPRSEFSLRSGFWSGVDDAVSEPLIEARTAVWDVILIKPALIAEERRWSFVKDGIEFTALMTDRTILQAIHERTLAIPLAEGVAMKIEVTYQERDDNGTWIPIAGSRRVRRVITPRPKFPPGPLFAASPP